MTIGRQYQTPYELQTDTHDDTHEEDPGSPATAIVTPEARDADLVDETDDGSAERLADERLADERLGDEGLDDERRYDESLDGDRVVGVDGSLPDDSVPDDSVPDDSVDAVIVDDADETPAFDVDDAADPDVTTYVPETPAGTHALSSEWQSLQGRFVDDPDAAVDEAAALVDTAIQRLLESLRDGTSGQDGDVSTEQKRLAFQRYRDVYEVLSST